LLLVPHICRSLADVGPLTLPLFLPSPFPLSAAEFQKLRKKISGNINSPSHFRLRASPVGENDCSISQSFCHKVY
jgi:hypothetical protein